MRVLCFGSVNLDHIYNVQEFVKPGETCKAISVETHCGGKGFNQAVAAAKAGLPVSLAGCIGRDGREFLKNCQQVGIDTSYLRQVEEPTGSAVIQVNQRGENCILLYGGANQAVTRAQINQTLDAFEPGDVLILQNEICELAYLVEEGARRDLRIALNPSPMNDQITRTMLEKVTWLFVNEVEAEQLCGASDPEECLFRLQQMCPEGAIVLTLGSAGSCYCSSETAARQPAFRVQAVDTTAAGDTFTGYFLAVMLKTGAPKRALQTASKAAAIAVTQKGAFDSIPWLKEVEAAQM